MKRTNQMMLRLSDREHERLKASMPPGEDMAAFARRALLAALDNSDPRETQRRSAAFVVACLSAEITFEEALALFDDHVPSTSKEVLHGGRE